MIYQFLRLDLENQIIFVSWLNIDFDQLLKIVLFEGVKDQGVERDIV